MIRFILNITGLRWLASWVCHLGGLYVVTYDVAAESNRLADEVERCREQEARARESLSESIGRENKLLAASAKDITIITDLRDRNHELSVRIRAHEAALERRRR